MTFEHYTQTRQGFRKTFNICITDKTSIEPTIPYSDVKIRRIQISDVLAEVIVQKRNHKRFENHHFSLATVWEMSGSVHNRSSSAFLIN